MLYKYAVLFLLITLSAGVAKAPGVKTITGTRVTDTGDIRAFAQAMAKLGYTSEQAADIWNRRYG